VPHRGSGTTQQVTSQEKEAGKGGSRSYRLWRSGCSRARRHSAWVWAEARFNSWYRANSGISVAGKTLTQWVQWTAANDKLPAEVCGSSVTASALQRQVFGKDPAAGNPWGA